MTSKLFPIFILSVFLPVLAHGATAPISFTSPRGGELYVIGQTQKVVVASKFKIVVVELSRDGGANFAALGTIDNRAIVDKSKLNQLPWNVTGPTSNRAQIRVTGKISLTDNRKDVTITSGDFSITETVTGLPDGSVTTTTLADKSVTAAKINSESASNGFLLFADGLGGATWNAPPFVKIAGDTMTGPLLLSGDPTQGVQAATKQFVDAETTRATTAEGTLTSNLNAEIARATTEETTLITNLTAEIARATAVENDLTSSKVAKSGDTMTGPLTLSGDPTIALHAATKQYVDSILPIPTSASILTTSTTPPPGFTYTGNSVPNNAWQPLADCPTYREFPSIGVVNNKIYAFGGTAAVYLANNDEYDPSSNSWSQKAPMQVARRSPFVGVVNNKIYVIGGDGGGNPQSNEEYDPSTNTWRFRAGADIGISDRSNAAVAVTNSKIYIVMNSGTLEYNPAANEWLPRSPLPVNRGYFIAVGYNKKVYVFGGSLNRMDIFDTESNVWNGGSPSPGPFQFNFATEFNGKLYTSSGFAFAPLKIFDPANDTWTSKSSVPATFYTSSACVVNDKILVIGSTVASYDPLAPEAFFVHTKN